MTKSFFGNTGGTIRARIAGTEAQAFSASGSAETTAAWRNKATPARKETDVERRQGFMESVARTAARVARVSLSWEAAAKEVNSAFCNRR
jgi:hypothetical protein